MYENIIYKHQQRWEVCNKNTAWAQSLMKLYRCGRWLKLIRRCGHLDPFLWIFIRVHFKWIFKWMVHSLPWLNTNHISSTSLSTVRNVMLSTISFSKVLFYVYLRMKRIHLEEINISYRQWTTETKFILTRIEWPRTDESDDKPNGNTGCLHWCILYCLVHYSGSALSLVYRHRPCAFVFHSLSANEYFVRRQTRNLSFYILVWFHFFNPWYFALTMCSPFLHTSEGCFYTRILIGANYKKKKTYW